MKSAGFIGRGNIGSELYKRLNQKVESTWIMDSKNIYIHEKEIEKSCQFEEYLKKSQIIFIAIPTLDKGQTALKYIEKSLENNIPVVTCEKGALSNYFYNLEDFIKEEKIGYSATVGGGSRLLNYLEERAGPQIEEIHAVVNGTLNYIFDQVSRGRSLGEVVKETQKLGYAEPGATHPIEVINKEATVDVPMKASILFNICNLTEKRMKAIDIKTHQIKDSELIRLSKEAINRRYIVSISRKQNNEEDTIWGFKHEINGWHISAGFKHIEDNPLFKELIPNGVNNAVLISEGKFGSYGSYKISGPGAGPEPTANSMIIDARKILTKNKNLY